MTIQRVVIGFLTLTVGLLIGLLVAVRGGNHMPVSINQVNPGPAQQFTGAPLKRTATIVNLDLNNTMWVGSAANTGPNVGQPIAAQGSIEWTGQQVYASVDSGVTAPIKFTISEDIQNYQNPVGVAQAIAQQGVPLVFTEEGVPGASPVTVTAGNVSAAIDVHKYATLYISAVNLDAASPCIIELQFLAPDNTVSGTVNLSGRFSSFNIQPVAVPVQGTQLFIINNSAHNVQLDIQGTNRPSTRVYELTDQLQFQQVTTGAIGFVAGTLNNLGDLNIPRTGQITITFLNTNPAGVKGRFGLQDVNGLFIQLASTANMPVDSLGEAYQVVNVNVSPLPVRLVFAADTSGTAIIAATVTG